MKPAVVNKTIEIISALFILLFVYTGITKLYSHELFLVTLKASPTISFAAGVLSWALPLTELFVSINLLVPSLRKAGLFMTTALMFLFSTYIAYMLSASSRLPCSCGGVISRLSWKQHLWLNIILLVVATGGWILQWQQIKLSR